jgi:hypothetical protein
MGGRNTRSDKEVGVVKQGDAMGAEDVTVIAGVR